MLFGEPTNNQIFTGHKGLMDYEITFIGKKSHASTPDKGISANMNAVKFLYELEDYYVKKIKVDYDNNYEVPYTTFNVGVIEGGSAKNSIAASCKITLDFRVIKNSHIKKIDKKIDSLINKYSSTKKVIDIIEPFVDVIDFLGGVKTTNFMTEASKVTGSKRLILGLGPVTAHEVNEHISIDSYELLVKQYKELVYKICSDENDMCN